MPALHDSSTHHSLLASLLHNESKEETWPIFVEQYGQLLHSWSLRWGASEHDAEEVVQETLLTIYQKLVLYRKQDGVYFRSWLKKIAYRCWLGVVKSNAVDGGTKASSGPECGWLQRLARAEARDDLLAEFDRMATEEILEMASRRVAARVEATTWRCYEMTYFEGLASRQVAELLGMNAPAVLMATSRVRQLLRREIVAIDPTFQLSER